MRLFFINMHRHWGGQSTALLFLATELARRGHDIIVAGVKDSELMIWSRKAGLKTFDQLELRRGFRLLSFRRELDVSSDGTLTLSVGRLAAEKGHDTLIRAWRRVADELPDAKLAIAGLGEQPPLQKIIDELKLERNVYLLGFRNDVPLLY